MAKSKLKSSKSQQFAAGGNTGMFGKSGAGTQKPGVTQKSSDGGGKFIAGGNTKMFGKSAGAVKPSKAGVTK